ncbi:hypothetical protein Nepgr_023206 [Nepenthes gracilis]|uniref:Uncharacterized protein n=1 Tax=Nepenthes gracilis TaxID=150966 RepID=A0AAD3T2G4_NEPGR|nr:hypothetical protein Nepgr_023206 [Nepenthes gracilis]
MLNPIAVPRWSIVLVLPFLPLEILSREDLPKPPSRRHFESSEGPRDGRRSPETLCGVPTELKFWSLLAVASVATLWGKSAVPSGVLMSPCDESLIDQGPAAAEPRRLHLPPTAEALRSNSPQVSDAGVVFLQYLLNYLPDEDYEVEMSTVGCEVFVGYAPSWSAAGIDSMMQFVDGAFMLIMMLEDAFAVLQFAAGAA